MILVTGATGNVGAEVVGALSRASADVRALVRNENAVVPPGVERAVGDLNDVESVADALAGVEGLFLLPGYQAEEGVLERASRAGVKHVVLLSGSSVTAADTDNAVSRYMIRSEEAVRASGLDWTIVRPCAFMSNTLRWLPQLAEGDVVRDAWGDVPVANVDPRDIGEVAARALLDGLAGRVLHLSGPEPLLPARRLAVLGAVLGRDLRFEALPDAVARAEMEAAMPVEYVDAFFSFYSGGTLDEAIVHPTVEEVTGRPPRTFHQWAEAHAAAFRS
ncbi:NAD(P)H-binding protein [Actinosynnema sp. NPDC023658]|uniref:NAD(P)H-binding protein n=1 Tax=Actinosynnema sp. NPDC023658 TaxID=3155465 RepID=UPI00340FDDE5